jgi:hypothetical protein
MLGLQLNGSPAGSIGKSIVLAKHCRKLKRYVILAR